MAVILRAIGAWLAKNSLDELIENTSGPDITAATSRPGILRFIEKKDELDSQRTMWGLLYTYNEIFREANVLLYFKRIAGVIAMGGVIANHGGYPNLHKFWEMIAGKKIFSSELKESHPDVHPEVRALLKTQMILLIEYVGFKRETALEMLEKHWQKELRIQTNYYYGHYWETPCCFLYPRKFSFHMWNRYGRIWDGAEDKWYARIRQIYKEEIFDKAEHKALDPSHRELALWDPPDDYEAARIDADGDWFNEDAERSAQELWKILTSYTFEWPGWVEAREYCNLNWRDLGIKIPLIPKR